MRVVHEPADDGGESRTLASDAETAETFREQATGLMFRESVPEDYALVFDFGEPPRWSIDGFAKLRTIHMLFVKVPLDVLWIVDGAVTKKKTVRPWTGFGMGKADVVMEMAAGAADDVEVGDAVRVVDDESSEVGDDLEDASEDADGGAEDGANEAVNEAATEDSVEEPETDA